MVQLGCIDEFRAVFIACTGGLYSYESGGVKMEKDTSE